MIKNVKQKGTNFEREVARFLDTLDVGVWQRVPSSGAIFGGKNKAKIEKASSSAVKALRGDLIAPDNIECVVECKNHANFPGGFHRLMAGGSVIMDGWLTEVFGDSEEGKIPHFLVFKITGTGFTFFVFPEKFFSALISCKSCTKYYSNATKLSYIIVEKQYIPDLKETIVEAIKVKNA